MPQLPFISILMPLFNREAHVGAAIQSLLTQSYPHFELIIIDDGSQDQSAAVVQQFTDPRIRFYQHLHNQGIVATRNHLLQKAQGSYIALLDSDDCAINPNRLQKQVQFLRQHPNYGGVSSWLGVIQNHCLSQEIDYYRMQDPDDLRVMLLFRNNFSNTGAMFLRSAVPEGGYRMRYPVAEDYDFFVRMAQNQRLSVIQAPLSALRESPQRTSHQQHQKLRTCTWEIAQYQLAWLGLSASPEEQFIHQRFQWRNWTGTILELEHAEAWLQKILHANDQTPIFCPQAMRRIVHQLWFSCCEHISNRRVPTWTHYCQSSLSRQAPCSLWSKTRLWLKHLRARNIP